jgi:site-specific recombinase XerD
VKLTKKVIDALHYEGTPPKGEDLRWDDEVKGFAVRVYPTGSKTYVFIYRYKGRPKRLSLGSTNVIPVDQAREMARLAKVQVYQQRDPSAERKRRNEGHTFGQLAARYETDHAPKKRSARNDLSMLRLHILPRWAKTPVQDLTVDDVMKLHQAISGGKTATRASGTNEGVAWRLGRAKGGLVVANRAVSLLSKMFNLARKWQFVKASWRNPVEDIERGELNREVRRKRSMQPAEVRKLFLAIQSEQNVFAAKAMWAYLITGVRKTSLLNLKRTDVDRVMKIVTYRVTKRGEPFIAPLTSHLESLLDSIPAMSGNPYYFCGMKPGRPLESIRRAWDRVKAEAGISDIRPHDLRRTVISWLTDSGFSFAQIGRAVDQSNETTTAGYAQLQLRPVAKVLEAHGRQLQAVIDAKDDAALEAIFEKIPLQGDPSSSSS